MNNQSPSYMQASQPQSRLQLNNEEIQHLLNKISSDEQKELTEIMRSCTSEVAMTRGLPVSALILGSLYFARTRLPKAYHFGPKGWPFYAIMGIGSMTVVNLFSMGMCRDRIQPRIEQLWTKYQRGAGSQTYDAMRAQNRQGAYIPPQRPVQDHLATPPTLAKQPRDTINQESHWTEPSMTSYNHDYHPHSDVKTFDLTEDPLTKPVVNRTPPQFLYDDSQTYMSGTPSNSRRNGF